jgi:hypothetical protein
LDTTVRKWSASAKALGSIGTLTMVLLLSGTACAERIGDCVEVRQGTGATRLAGYTEIACDQHCKQATGLLNCYWDNPFGPVGLNPTPRGPGLAESGTGDRSGNQPNDLARFRVAIEL